MAGHFLVLSDLRLGTSAFTAKLDFTARTRINGLARCGASGLAGASGTSTREGRR